MCLQLDVLSIKSFDMGWKEEILAVCSQRVDSNDRRINRLGRGVHVGSNASECLFADLVLQVICNIIVGASISC